MDKYNKNSKLNLPITNKLTTQKYQREIQQKSLSQIFVIFEDKIITSKKNIYIEKRKK